MNINLPSGKDGVHVYVLPKDEQSAAEEGALFSERYLIVRDEPRGQESLAEIVEPTLNGDCDA